MSAVCRCINGHDFTSRVVEDDPDTNSLVLGEEECPECGATEFDVLEIEDDFEDLDEVWEPWPWP